MKSLKNIGKALLIIIFCISVNLLCDKFLFAEKMDAPNLGGAISGGIGTGLVLTYFVNRQKRRAALQSNG